MSKAPSEKTQLVTAKRTIRSLRQELQNVSAEVTRYRTRATQAEQSAAAWRDRFDKLLHAVGEQTSLGKEAALTERCPVTDAPHVIVNGECTHCRNKFE